MTTSAEELKKIKDLSVKEFEDGYLMFKKNRLYSFLGGAVIFLVAAGFVSYKAALEAVKSTGAETAINRIEGILEEAENDSTRISGLVNIYEGKIDSIGVPTGTIVAYHGSGSIPPGWVICDGRDGTPDLTNRFIYGASGIDDNRLGQPGGLPVHSHVITIQNNTDVRGERTGDENDNDYANAGHIHSAASNEVSNLPPYVKLLYIMKK